MISEMSWADEMNGAITAMDYNSTTGQTSNWQFLRTTDGGQTWNAVSVADNYFSSFCLVPGTPGMIVITKSSSASLAENFSAYSTDWGTTWEMLDDSIQYIQVKMYDINTGWAGGFNWDENSGGIYKWKGINMGLHFTSLPVTTVEEYAEYSYTVVAENETDAPITITKTSGPEWLTLAQVEGEYVLSGTAPHVTGLSEDFNVILTADDGTETVTQPFTITVTTTNTAPVFTSEPITTATKDVEYVYNVTCEDADGDDITITATQIPSWATFTDNGDGTAVLSGTSPNVTTAGSGSRIILVAADLLHETTQSFYIRTTASIEDFGMGAIAIYPNPTDGMLTIDNCEGSTYEIFDVTGKMIATGMINSSTETINIESEITGNLVIRIINSNKVINHNIVKF